MKMHTPVQHSALSELCMGFCSFLYHTPLTSLKPALKNLSFRAKIGVASKFLHRFLPYLRREEFLKVFNSVVGASGIVDF